MRALLKFAEKSATVTSQEKMKWVRQRRKEAQRLLRKHRGGIESIPYEFGTTSNWQTHAKTFWISFYDRFRERQLPAVLLGSSDVTENFGGQLFLKHFLDNNSKICVCPVCDATAFFTIAQQQRNLKVYTDIDHYLPKDLYPHLSIHPYNLVPLCHNCNSGLKAAKDPLTPNKSTRYRLEDIWLPYHHRGLHDDLYMRITEKKGKSFFDTLLRKTTPNLPQQRLNAVVDVLNHVYDIPGRWKERMDEIYAKLFRRIRDYSRFSELSLDDDSALDYLDELLFLFDSEDVAKEPYVIAMIWMLVSLLNEDQINELHPLRDEILSWGENQRMYADRMRKYGRIIRNLQQS